MPTAPAARTYPERRCTHPDGARTYPEGLARRTGEKNGNAPTRAAPGRSREGWSGLGYSLSAQLDFWVLFFWST